MTAEKKLELHRRFIPGINLSLVVICLVGIISATSMLNRGYDAILENQRVNRVHSDSLTTATGVRIENNVNERFHKQELRLQRIEDKLDIK